MTHIQWCPGVKTFREIFYCQCVCQFYKKSKAKNCNCDILLLTHFSISQKKLSKNATCPDSLRYVIAKAFVNFPKKNKCNWHRFSRARRKGGIPKYFVPEIQRKYSSAIFRKICYCQCIFQFSKKPSATCTDLWRKRRYSEIFYSIKSNPILRTWNATTS